MCKKMRDKSAPQSYVYPLALVEETIFCTFTLNTKELEFSFLLSVKPLFNNNVYFTLLNKYPKYIYMYMYKCICILLLL